MQTRRRTWLTVMGMVLGVAASAWGQAVTFESPFTAEQIDLPQCRQFRNGVASNAVPETVKTILGFNPTGVNREPIKWSAGQVADGKETTFDYLVVLKQEVDVGSVWVDVADETYKGSKNNGEVWYLKKGVAGTPDPAKADQWVKVSFGTFVSWGRAATLPVGVKSRAFLYRDIRVGGTSIVDHWRWFRARLFSVTPDSSGIAAPLMKADDPDRLVRGEWWTVRLGADGTAISAKNPASGILMWAKPQKLTGFSFRSNARDFIIQVLSPGEKGEPAAAPEASWITVKPTAEHTDRHDNGWGWACSYRWISIAPTEARAVRFCVTTMDSGKEAWLHGIGAFVDLQAAPVPVQTVRDDKPPFRIKYAVPLNGTVALVLEDGKGSRLKNLTAELERPAGPAEEPWDLKDKAGNYVAPGTYRLRGIAGPNIELLYQVTPYPNVDQLWPDRTPWLQEHSGPHGWLADHSGIQAVATVKDRVYFGAAVAEAGVSLAECDLNGKKQWGKNGLSSWSGPYMMGGDGNRVYIAGTDGALYVLDPATHEVRHLSYYGGGPRQLVGVAGNAGKMYLAFQRTGSKIRIDEAAMPANNLVMEPMLPTAPYAVGQAGMDYWVYMIGMLRLQGPPPGKSKEGAVLRTNVGSRQHQYIMLPFRDPVPIGSVVFPYPEGKAAVSLSVLAPNAPYPPRPTEEKDWIPFENSGKAGWNCVAAPTNTLTRALRITFTNKDYDDFDDVLSEVQPAAGRNKNPDLDDDMSSIDLAPKEKADMTAAKKATWAGQIDGLRIVRRRFANLFPSAKVRVSSGTVKPDGEWDAARAANPISPDSPAYYVMEWDKPQKICGLAIKEIDAERTEIDVWQGPVTGTIPLDAPVLAEHSQAAGWKHVATYKQYRRKDEWKMTENNPYARYMDGTVNFTDEEQTRAVRLRVEEQWFDNGYLNSECRRAEFWAHGVHYTQQPCAKLRSDICKVYGVAPLSYIGGEVPLPGQAGNDFIAVVDGQTGKWEREIASSVGWHGLAFGPKGDLFAIDRNHQSIVKIDQDTGKQAVVVPQCEPSVMTVGPDGLFYVLPWTDNARKPVQVYDTAGKLVRTIGKPGGLQVGLWDPQRFMDVPAMVVDQGGSLWVIGGGTYPRRVTQFKTDGTFVKEILGNTFYGGGGGGVLDRYDASRAWYGPVEFKIDWKTHTSKINAFVTEGKSGLAKTSVSGGVESDLVPLRVPSRQETYMVSTPLSLGDRQSYGEVRIYDEKTHTARLVAAVGDGAFFAPLRSSKLLALCKGGVPKDFTFIWSDRNGNNEVDPEEVDYKAKEDFSRIEGVGRFDNSLGCVGPGVRYDVKEYLANGTPVYQRVPIPMPALMRLDNGNYFTLHTMFNEESPCENYAATPKGEKLWGYEVGGGGVSGLNVPPWYPGRVCNQFAIIGHETAPAGDLGEFVVVHANSGEWNIWTADGLLAGQVLLDKTHPRAQFFGPSETKPGLRMDPLSANQEHSHGFFTRTEADNKYYIIAGFSYMTIMEVQGLDKFKRFATDFTVTPKDIENARAWEVAQAQRRAVTRSLVLKAIPMASAAELDGSRSPTEWTTPAVPIDESGAASFSMGYDKNNLYLCWELKDLGTLRNAGAEFQRYFKTGAALDFSLGTDPTADPKRTKPGNGDIRLLVAFLGDKKIKSEAAVTPTVVLYQPVAPGAKPEEGWITKTEAAGETKFDRVKVLTDAKVGRAGDKNVVVEVAVPLRDIGLTIKEGMRLKMDWGVLTSKDGYQVKQRLYWANKTATGTSDESMESRLEPNLWGTVEFPGTTIEDDLKAIETGAGAGPSLD